MSLSAFRIKATCQPSSMGNPSGPPNLTLQPSQAVSRPFLSALLCPLGTYLWLLSRLRTGATTSMKPFLTTCFFFYPLCPIQTSGVTPVIFSFFSSKNKLPGAKGPHLIYLTTPVPRTQPDKQQGLNGHQVRKKGAS